MPSIRPMLGLFYVHHQGHKHSSGLNFICYCCLQLMFEAYSSPRKQHHVPYSTRTVKPYSFRHMPQKALVAICHGSYRAPFSEPTSCTSHCFVIINNCRTWAPQSRSRMKVCFAIALGWISRPVLLIADHILRPLLAQEASNAFILREQQSHKVVVTYHRQFACFLSLQLQGSLSQPSACMSGQDMNNYRTWALQSERKMSVCFATALGSIVGRVLLFADYVLGLLLSCLRGLIMQSSRAIMYLPDNTPDLCDTLPLDFWGPVEESQCMYEWLIGGHSWLQHLGSTERAQHELLLCHRSWLNYQACSFQYMYKVLSKGTYHSTPIPSLPSPPPSSLLMLSGFPHIDTHSTMMLLRDTGKYSCLLSPNNISQM